MSLNIRLEDSLLGRTPEGERLMKAALGAIGLGPGSLNIGRRAVPEASRKLSYEEVYSLRRYAAHIELDAKPPALPWGPGAFKTNLRSLVEQTGIDEVQRRMAQRPQSFIDLVSSAKAAADSDPAVEELVARVDRAGPSALKSFPHVFDHSDSQVAGRYFLPIDFDFPVLVRSRSESYSFGSSHRLRSELTTMNQFLGIPIRFSLDSATYRKAVSGEWRLEKEAWCIFYWFAAKSISSRLIVHLE